MIFYAIMLNDKFVGFINSAEQQAFLLECNANHTFYEFEWGTGHNPPPMPTDVVIKDGKIELVTNTPTNL